MSAAAAAAAAGASAAAAGGYYHYHRDDEDELDEIEMEEAPGFNLVGALVGVIVIALLALGGWALFHWLDGLPSESDQVNEQLHKATTELRERAIEEAQRSEISYLVDYCTITTAREFTSEELLTDAGLREWGASLHDCLGRIDLSTGTLQP